MGMVIEPARSTTYLMENFDLEQEITECETESLGRQSNEQGQKKEDRSREEVKTEGNVHKNIMTSENANMPGRRALVSPCGHGSQEGHNWYLPKATRSKAHRLVDVG